MKDSGITIIEPKRLQLVGAKFKLVGFCTKDWLERPWGSLDDRIFTEYLDSEGRMFFSGTIYIHTSRFWRFFNKYWFGQIEDISQSGGTIRDSQGRITLKISSHDDKKLCIYIPLVVPELEPEQGPDQSLVKRHAKMGEIVERYQKDLEDYYTELKKINDRRKTKNGGIEPHYVHGPESLNLAHEMARILEDSEDSFEEYEYSEEDDAEKELEEKYQKALEWRGPLFRGLIAKFGEFELRTYSDDHGQHFHVIHKEKRINARFSFPELKLINYKQSRNTITSKQEARIKEYCLQPEVFQRIGKWFEKRGV